jgi:hypothetical protein
MERVVVNRSFTLYKTFYEGGVATDPDSSPTVAITRATGEVVPTGAIANETDPGTWSVTVEASENTLLDYLTVTWTAIVNAEPQIHVDYVEVAGGFLFSIPALESISLGGTSTIGTRFSTAQVVEMRTTVETAIEDEYGTALVPRYKRETLTHSTVESSLRLKPVIRTIRDATVNGTALSEAQLATLTFGPAGVYGYPWTGAYSNITVGYEYGLDHPPPRIQQAALRLARQWLVNGPIDDRAAVYNIADGGTYSMVVPGRNGSIFGMPELDAIIHASPYRLGVA